jgi:hypothetical protein
VALTKSKGIKKEANMRELNAQELRSKKFTKFTKFILKTLILKIIQIINQKRFKIKIIV